MASMRVGATLLLALILGFAGHVAAQPTPGQELIPLPPCRVADTRGNGFTGGYGPPALIGGASRDFVIAGQCGVPSAATAVSFNFTVVNATPPSGFLTVYPAGGAVPVAALLQFGPGQSAVVSNSANVLLGPGGVISVRASNTGGTVDLIINVYGYFTDTEQLANQNTAVGASALQSLTSGSENTAFGAGALQGNTTGSQNTASGASALRNNDTGSGNTGSGAGALFSNSVGSQNTASGVNALQSNTAGESNTASGASALQSNTTGSQNTASGVNALAGNTIGGSNVASGFSALQGNTTGSDNTGSGFGALASNTTGTTNTADGSRALFFNTTGAGNTASGHGALQNNTTGIGNTALGDGALGSNTTGGANIAVGSGAGSLLTSGSNNIYLGSSAGAAAEADTMRLGASQISTFIAGIAGQVVSNSAPVLIDTSTGQLGTLVSSLRYKSDIEPMGARSRALIELRPVVFRYTQDPRGERQYGLIAEEVADVYPELVTRNARGQVDAIRYHELTPMLLNEVQHQQQALSVQQRQLGAHAREIAALQAQNAALAARLERLEAAAARAAMPASR
jgi:hypothetical protein